ncbi:hypothetical protein B484DRAFT_390922, partial [Ochromonadaceae sp. CCMP2298]
GYGEYWVSEENAADAYYLGGWTKVHDDDHTGAYAVWGRGHLAVPSSELLAVQWSKRKVWDEPLPWESEDEALLGGVREYVGGSGGGSGSSGSSGISGTTSSGSDTNSSSTTSSNNNSSSGGRSPAPADADGHGKEDGNGDGEGDGNGNGGRDGDIDGDGFESVPALALFHPTQRHRGVVFRSKEALMTSDECAAVLREVHTYHSGRAWGTVRHSSVKTTDVAVESVGSLRDWLRVLLATRVYPMIQEAFPVLADGSSMGSSIGGHGNSGRSENSEKSDNGINNSSGSSNNNNNTSTNNTNSHLRVHDAFIVRYDSLVDGSLSLPEHCDTSAVSVILSLNSQERGDYVGGGTWFEALGGEGEGGVGEGEGEAEGDRGDTEVKIQAQAQAQAQAQRGQHAGFPISQGTRHVLVLFLYVQDFHYGPLLSAAKKRVGGDESKGGGGGVGVGGGGGTGAGVGCVGVGAAGGPALLASGGEVGGFVVYKQTVDLVSLLKRALPQE